MALFEQISDTIWDEIISGRIKVGEKLKDTDWAARTGASRTPVREALRALVRDGVLLQRKAGGFALRQITPEEVVDLYHYRAALEGAALQAAITGKTAVNTKEMGENIEQAYAELDQRNYDDVLKRNSRFHELLLTNCANQFINDALQSVHRMVMFARVSVLNQTSLARVAEYENSLRADLEDHKVILEKIIEQDFDAATSTLESHIRRTGDDMAGMLGIQ